MKEELRLYFEMYLEYAAEQRVIIREIDRDPDTHLPYPMGKGKGKAHYLPYTTRFDGNYAVKLQKKLRKLKFKYGTLLTLTVDPKRFKNIHEATEALKKGWNRVHRSLNRRFGNLTYLSVLEFGTENDMPHLHILIEKIHFSREGISWLRNLWEKSVGTFINVRQIRDQNAGNYVLKYLQKTFTEDGTSIAEGNAWCYWITNSKFYSTSVDVKERMLTMDEIRDDVLAAWLHYDIVTGLLEPPQFEYIGIVPLSVLGSSPPKILTDQWLTEKGWLYSEEHECWFYAGVGDIN